MRQRDEPTFDLRERIVELKTQNLPTCHWYDLFEEDIPNRDAFDTPEFQELANYFSVFMDMEDRKCPGCQLKFGENGIVSFLLSGGGTITRLEWSLAHGEAYCVTCHWPYRVYHRDLPLIKFGKVAMPYHVSELSIGE